MATTIFDYVLPIHAFIVVVVAVTIPMVWVLFAAGVLFCVLLVNAIVRSIPIRLRNILNQYFPTAGHEESFMLTHRYSVMPVYRVLSAIIAWAPPRDYTPYPPRLNGFAAASYMPAVPIKAMIKHPAHGWWSASKTDRTAVIACFVLLLVAMYTFRVEVRYGNQQYSYTQVLVNCPEMVDLQEKCYLLYFKSAPVKTDVYGNLCSSVNISTGCVELLQQRNRNAYQQCGLLNKYNYPNSTEDCFAEWHFENVLLDLFSAIFFPASLFYVAFYAPVFYARRVAYPSNACPGLATRLRDIKIPPVLVPHGARHTHPLAAASRNQADASITGHIFDQGYEPYCIQMSPKDVANKYAGSLRHLWAGTDTHSPERSDPLRSYHYLKFMNVDYYVEWADYLWTCNPVIMYTFTPTVPCGTFQETSWTVNEESEIIMTIAGGATYTHKLWNYNVDSFEAVYPGVTITYSLERVAVNEHWSIITLTPKSVCKNTETKTYTTLKRINFVQTVVAIDGVERRVALQRNHVGGLSLSLPGQFMSVTLTPALQVMLKARSRKAIAFSDLVVILQADFGADCRLAQAIVYECFPSSGAVPSVVSILEAKNIAISYRRVAAPALQVIEKPSATVLCPAVLDSAYAPMRCKANDQWCVEKRITDVHNPQTILGGEKHSHRYMGYAREFIRLLVPTPHQYCPKEITDVILSQNRPTQRRNNARAAPMISSFLANEEMEVKSFQKGEIYPAPKDPRNISTLPPEHCLVYSTYMQVVAEILKGTAWYAFGLHPNKVAERIHRMAAKALTLIETDFSRFDGTHSMAFYEHLELALLLRIFHPSQHNLITTVHRMMCQAKARTSWGVKYDPDGSRLSGAADTSAGNSIDNAYVNFSAFRRQGCTPEVAWEKLGFYGGDDGVTPDVDGPMLEEVVRDLNLSLKAKARKPWEALSFLGRIYTCPSAGPQHCADLPRQLSKLHAHPSSRVEFPMVALYNKALGHSVTDSLTPILGAWVLMVFRTCAPVLDSRYQSYSYTVSPTPLDQRYVPSREAMLNYAVSVLNVTVQDIIAYEAHLNSITSPMLIQPLTPRVVQLPTPGVILGQDLVVAPALQSVVPASNQSTPACLNGTCPHLGCHPVSPLRSYVRLPPSQMEGKGAPDAKLHPLQARANDSKRAPIAPAVKPCFAFASGTCTRVNCKFAHVIVAKTDHPCKDFQKGHCVRPTCKFSHIPVKPRVVPPPINATPALRRHDNPLAP